ncbi:MAG: CHAT domain-containing protein, partial [Prochlorotrichaceae cyanobacterium]
LAGGGGTDTLRGTVGNDSFTLTGGNAGAVDDASTILSFSAIANLDGQEGNDTFTLSGGTLSGSINGGLGVDLFTAGNVANTFIITSLNAGTVTGVTGGFTGIENLTGGTANDSFTLNGGTLSGVITGGDGTNALTGSPDNDSFDLDNLINVGILIGGGGSDTLSGTASTDTFIITGNNAGTVGSLSFSAMTNLDGQEGDDTFTLNGGTVSGAIAGGTGTDTLIGDNVANTFTLSGVNTGTITGVAGGFSDIERLIGGTANDTFTLATATAGVTSLIEGGLGTDAVIAFPKSNEFSLATVDSGLLNGFDFSGIENFGNLPIFLAIAGGDNQSTTVNTNFAENLSVLVTDSFNAGVAGATVTLNIPSGVGIAGGTAVSSVLTTDATGLASTPLTANTVAGRYSVGVTSGNGLTGTFNNLTNLADVPSRLGIVSGDNQTAIVATAFDQALTVQLTDQFGNPLSGVPISFSLDETAETRAGVTFSTTLVTTDANGFAQIAITANNEPGSFQVVATTNAGSVSPVTFSLENIVFEVGICPPNCDVNNQTGTIVAVPVNETVDSRVLEVEEDTIAIEEVELTESIIPISAVEILDAATFEASEAEATNDFATYLGIPVPPSVTPESAATTLRNLNEVTGTSTAYVAFRFRPTTESTPTQSRQDSVSPSAELTEIITILPSAADKSLLTTPEKMLAQLEEDGSPNDALEAMILTASGEPVLRRLPVTRSRILQFASFLYPEISAPSSFESDRYLVFAQRMYRELILPLEEVLTEAGIDSLLLSLDQGLRLFPWGALYDGEQFLIEKYSMGITPSFSLTNTTYVTLQERSALIMGASDFAEQAPLPAVPAELASIAQQLGAEGYFINEDFTLDNLKQAREDASPGIIHLATHGDFSEGNLDNSYIQLWGDERLYLNQMQELEWFTNPPVELLVLSACRTAFGSTEAELGFGGLAVNAGVRSALASLWYVSDAGTLALMNEFYQQLRDPEVKTKAEALRQAQIAMIRGNINITGNVLRGGTRSPYGVELPDNLVPDNTDLQHPYYWAAFTLIGSPW